MNGNVVATLVALSRRSLQRLKSSLRSLLRSSLRSPSTAFFAWRIILYEKLSYSIVALCWILFHSWHVIPGLLAKAFFDALEGRTQAGLTLESIVALVVAAGLAKIVILFGGVRPPRAPWRFRVESLLRRNMLARILERPGARSLPGSVGEAISTLRDDTEPMSLMGDWAYDALAGSIFAVAGIAILLAVDARVTLFVFAPIVIVIVLAHIARTRLERLRAQSREATAQVTGSIGEIFGAVQAIQVAGAEEKVIAHLRQLGDRRQRAMLRDRLQSLSLDAIFANTASLGAGLTLLVAASAMRDGQFSVGDFALFATYLMQVSQYTGFLGYLIATYRQSGVSFGRAVALLQGAPAKDLVTHHPLHLEGKLPALAPMISTSRNALDGLSNPSETGGFGTRTRPGATRDQPLIKNDRLDTLEVSGLTLRHPDTGRGIEDVSFKIDRGRLTVISGRIGSGKTTLLRAMLGLLEPEAGEVYWNGQRIADPAKFLAPPRVAYTAQIPTLISGTLRENILLGLSSDTDRMMAAVRSAALERDVAGFADGLETLIGTRGMKLSGGQIQRTAAARMFVREAELLILDDLSSALDVETEQILWQRLFERRATCLVVSHRRAVLERADQILMLDDGRIIAQGTFEELVKLGVEIGS